jgi:hypothetical protein
MVNHVCVLAMPHVHCNDTVGQINADAIHKRWDSSGNRKSIRPLCPEKAKQDREPLDGFSLDLSQKTQTDE